MGGQLKACSWRGGDSVDLAMFSVLSLHVGRCKYCQKLCDIMHQVCLPDIFFEGCLQGNSEKVAKAQP